MATFSKAASLGPFGPNSRILFKAGDTWNETFLLAAGSRGRFAESVYKNTYASTLAANQATYLAGTQFSDMQTLLVNAGQSSGTATTNATEYCRRLAHRDATLAGHAAAQPASSWVTIGRYGAGANPVIDGLSTNQWGIDLSGSDQHYGGGFKIIDIDIKNCLVAGIRAEGKAPLPNATWITASTPGGATIQAITGVSFNPVTHTLTTPISGYSHFTALGIDCVNTNYMFLENYNVVNTDTPWFSISGFDTVNLNMAATHSYYLHPYCAEFLSRAVIKNCVMDDMCNIGLASGRAGLFVAVGTDYILDGVEVKNGPSSSNAIDMEGQLTNFTMLNCNLHDQGGAAILHNSNGGQNTGTMIVDCTVIRCANLGTDTQPNFIQTNPVTLNDPLIVARCTITKDPDQPYLFSGPTYSTSKTNTITDRIPNATMGPDNTVT